MLWNNGRLEHWNIGCNLQSLKRFFQPSFHYSSIPVNPPYPFSQGGERGD
jgi:hypothetical protein